jgi:hypothetical protein
MKKLLIPILFIGSMIMIYVMTVTGATLKTTATPKGILDLEFACNISKATIVTAAWTPNNTVDNIGAAKINTYLDFIFLFFYALFLFFACKKIARLCSGGFSKIGLLIAKGALLAGFLDVLENAGMLITLSGNSTNSIALLTTVFNNKMGTGNFSNHISYCRINTFGCKEKITIAVGLNWLSLCTEAI